MRQTLALADGPDPKTQAFLREQLDPVFGYRGMVRFSWATVKVLLDKNGHPCHWADDVTNQPSVAAHFGGSNSGEDKGRPKVWRDLGISSVGEL